jgi:DNA-binding transcriptional regulator YdaS (Cro superfamily)
MATVTASYNWVSGETVTPTKLNTTAAPTVVVADNEVTTAKILDGNVTDAKLASDIDASKLTTGTLPIARIADGAVATAKIADGAVATAKIADGAVSAAKLAAKVTFPNYTAGVTQNYNTLYQAATDGYLVIRAVGSFINGIEVVVGTTSSPTSVVWQAGDDINSNTKRAATMLPIPKDIYYKVQPISGVAGFESVFMEWYPVIS